MGNKKINVTGKSYSGNPITDEVVPVSHQWILGKFPRKQYNNGTIVTSIVKSDGTNTQTFMDSLGNPSYELIINGSDSLARDYHAGRLFNAYKNFKPGTVGFERIAKDSKQYNVPLATPEEAAANLKEVKRQFNNLQEGGEIPSNDQQQLFVAIITDMAKTLGVEPSQEFAEAVMTAFENQDDSQGLLTLFTKTKNKFMNETGLFREGGKMIAFIEKFKCGGKSPKKKTSKKQEGGEVEGEGIGYLTTPVNDRQMRRNWREATGGTRREARQTQRNLTDYIEGQGGISHGGARNAAAAMMGDPQRFAQPQESKIIGGVSIPTLNVPAPQLETPANIEHNYDNFDFSKAFGRARGNGEDTFMWRGKEYTTELAPEPAAQTRPDLTAPSVNGGVYPDYYYNNLAAAGARWREKWNAKRTARKEREAALRAKAAEMNANHEPVSFTEAAMKVIPSRRS